MKMSNCTGAMVLTGEIIEGNVVPVFKMNGGRHYLSIGSIEAADYPVGTRVTITLEEPEPPKESIVLPEGMQWKNNNLWYHGARIARVNTLSSGGYHCIPNSTDHVYFKKFESMEEGKRSIESALAEHGYFGVRKVVEGEQ